MSPSFLTLTGILAGFAFVRFLSFRFAGRVWSACVVARSSLSSCWNVMTDVETPESELGRSCDMFEKTALNHATVIVFKRLANLSEGKLGE